MGILRKIFKFWGSKYSSLAAQYFLKKSAKINGSLQECWIIQQRGSRSGNKKEYQ